MKKSFHTVKKAGILTAAAVLGTAALAGCGSKADITESAAASEEATEAVGEAEASDAQLVIAGGDSAGLIAAVQAAAEGMDPSKILILAPGEELAADMAEMAPYVNAANTDEQFQANLTDDFEIYLSDIMTAGNNTNNSDMLPGWADGGKGPKKQAGHNPFEIPSGFLVCLHGILPFRNVLLRSVSSNPSFYLLFDGLQFTIWRCLVLFSHII